MWLILPGKGLLLYKLKPFLVEIVAAKLARPMATGLVLAIQKYC
jgi:hypothetical protein